MKAISVYICFIANLCALSTCTIDRGSSCLVEKHGRSPDFTYDLRCEIVQSDSKSLEQVLQKDDGVLKNYYQPAEEIYRLSEIASKVNTIQIKARYTDIKIGGNVLNRFTNLAKLFFNDASSGQRKVIIDSNEFSNTPRLESIQITGFILDESTIEALASLKDRLKILYIEKVSPKSKIPFEIARFTKLEKVHVFDACGPEPFPASSFENSANTLKYIEFDGCYLPKITKTTFGNMPNLVSIDWYRGNITEIESGAFDGLPNLNFLNLEQNQIRNLPDGLFERNRKLLSVDFTLNQGLQGLSAQNFTHVENFNQFRLRL